VQGQQIQCDYKKTILQNYIFYVKSIISSYLMHVTRKNSNEEKNNHIVYHINSGVGNYKKPLIVPLVTYFNLKTRNCDRTSASLLPCPETSCNKTEKIHTCIIQAFFIPNSYQASPHSIYERMSSRSASIQNKFL
jgi:hypothetical protein